MIQISEISISDQKFIIFSVSCKMILSCLITFHSPKDDVLSIFDSIRGNCADANFRISVRFRKAPENPKKGKKDDKKSAKDKKGKSKAQSTKASRPESQAEVGFRKK